MADATQDSADGYSGGWCGSGGVSGSARFPFPLATPLSSKIASASTAGVREQRRILPLPRTTRPDAARRRCGDVEGRGGVRERPTLTTALVSLAVGGLRKRRAATDEGPQPDVTAAFVEIRELKMPKVETCIPLHHVPPPVQQPRGAPLLPPFYGWDVATMSRPQQVVDPWGHLQGQERPARRLQGPAVVVAPQTNLAMMRPSPVYTRPIWW